MGNTEGGTPTKSEKASSPAQEHSAVPAYPDWTAFQAYYPGVGMPPPYFGSAVASGHPPHPYLWGPQPLLPPYGSPAYAALYSHGGMYAHHPSMTLGPHPHGHVVSTAGANEATGGCTETPSKSSNSKDQGLVKKLKGFDGLAVSIGNGNVDASDGQTHRQSQSADSGSEGSSEGSDGNTGGRKRIAEELTLNGKSSNVDPKANGEAHASSSRSLAIAAVPPAGMTAEGVPVSGMTPGVEFRNLASPKSKVGNAAPGLQPAGVIVPAREALPSELWLQDERELKRERRKQSNRESARRSRLRKQAETEELAMKVETLNSENLDLREELNRLKEKSEKLKQENLSLMEKVKKAQMERAGGAVILDKIEAQPAGVENFLSRMSNASQVNRSGQREAEGHENTGKLHQLLESNSRTDAVAAG
ncbi:unnamed protein product [Victoria cruziana]